jgi:osmotically-inducible protein OsmY
MKTNTVMPLNVGQELQWCPCIQVMSEALPVRYSGPFKQSDEDLGLGVFKALSQNVSVPRGQVNIRVQDGVVTLSGEIGWEYQKFAAEEAVRYLIGVVSINNQITIKPKVNSRW